jgi:hypothetical protein
MFRPTQRPSSGFTSARNRRLVKSRNCAVHVIMGDNFLQYENKCREIMSALWGGKTVLLAMPADNLRQSEDTDKF